jgi:hypothetical protein
VVGAIPVGEGSVFFADLKSSWSARTKHGNSGIFQELETILNKGIPS